MVDKLCFGTLAQLVKPARLKSKNKDTVDMLAGIVLMTVEVKNQRGEDVVITDKIASKLFNCQANLQQSIVEAVNHPDVIEFAERYVDKDIRRDLKPAMVPKLIDDVCALIRRDIDIPEGTREDLLKNADLEHFPTFFSKVLLYTFQVDNKVQADKGTIKSNDTMEDNSRIISESVTATDIMDPFQTHDDFMDITEYKRRTLRIATIYDNRDVNRIQDVLQFLSEQGHELTVMDGNSKPSEVIQNCDTAVFFLSKHSALPTSPVRMSLCRVMDVFEGNFQTVLLDSLNSMNASSTLLRSLVEMTDATGRNLDTSWRVEKMSELNTKLLASESREDRRRRRVIRDKLGITIDSGKQDSLNSKSFIGREWLYDEVERWLNSPNASPLCVLYGDPGVGKSAFAAHIIRRNPNVVAGVFCQYNRPHDSEPKAVIKALAYQLSCRIADYQSALLSILNEEKGLDKLEEVELFNRLFEKPLKQVSAIPYESRLCMVIDSLDESPQGKQTVFARMLSCCSVYLPSWIRILVTTREIPTIQGAFSRAFQLHLNGERAENRADVQSYFVRRLGEQYKNSANWSAALTNLVERSGGIFLYAELVSDSILEGRLSIDNIEHFPTGLSAAFDSWFNWAFPDEEEYQMRFRLPVGVLLVTSEPIPSEELQRVFDWDENEVKDFLRHIRPLLRSEQSIFGKETVAFSHEYISQWLESEDAGIFRSDPRAAKRKMTERFYELYRKSVDRLTEFEVLYLTDLLYEYCGAESWEETMMDKSLYEKVVHVGDSYKIYGESKQSRRCYEKAKVMAERMVNSRGDAEDYRRLGISYEKVGDVLYSIGLLDDAMSMYMKQHEVFVRLNDIDNDVENQRYLGCSYLKLADVQLELGKPDEALEYYKQAKNTSEPLVVLRAKPIDFWNVGVSISRTADIYSDRGNLERAGVLYEEGVRTLLDKLLCSGESSEQQISMLISQSPLIIVERIADINCALGKADSAISALQDNLVKYKELLCSNNVPDIRRSLFVTYFKLSNLMELCGKSSDAFCLLQDALDLAKSNTQMRGSLYDWLDLGSCYQRIADVFAQKCEADTAMSYYQKARTIFEQAVRERGTPEDHRYLGGVYNNIAVLLESIGDFNGASKYYHMDYDISEHMVEKWNTFADKTDFVCACWNNLQFAQDIEEKRKYARKALPVANDLYSEAGQEHQRELIEGFQCVLNSVSESNS